MIEARLYALELLEELRRDLPFLDFAAMALPRREVEACVVARADGVLAGAEEAAEFLALLGLRVTRRLEDGAAVRRGDRLLCFRGEAPEVAKVERTLLNLLMRASGIATATRRLLERARAANPRVRVAATRKTVLRYMDKKAVWVGGGDPHRFSLSDAVMFKDTHLAVAPLEALMAARRPFIHRVEVEASTVEEALKAAEAGADAVLLDNMTPEDVRRVHEELERRGLRGKVLLEASGGITEDNVALYAPYVDVVSSGALTHSARALDMALEVSAADGRLAVGLLGVGRLGRQLLQLARDDPDYRVVKAYDVDRGRCLEAERHGAACASGLDDLLAGVDLLVEAASPQAVLEAACRALEAGVDVVVASVGALTRLEPCGRGVIYVPSGAVGGLDLAAAAGGRVRHRVEKAAFGAVERGEAGEMFWRYPASLNASVALRLASGSPVEVEVAPGRPGVNVHHIAVEHPLGRAEIRVENSAEGPTSLLTALSIHALVKSVARLRAGRARLVVGTFKAL